MTKILTTQNAQITTAAVEVKTLTISGKQVTLAVFRQLQEKPLLALDFTLNGVPWGVVNYHPDKCGDEAEHLHVVWQHGDTLLRSKVFSPDTAAGRSLTFSPGRLIEACFGDGLDHAAMATFGITRVFIDSGRRVSDNTHECLFAFDGVTFRGRVRSDFSGNEWHLRRKPALYNLIAAETGPYESVAQLTDRLRPSREYRAIWQTLTALPHLFIAV